MSSPLTIGTTAELVAPIRKNRASIRFQNTGTHTIYMKKIPSSGVFTPPTPSDYEVLLAPSSNDTEAGEAFVTNSISAFAAVGASAGSLLAVYETKKVGYHG